VSGELLVSLRDIGKAYPLITRPRDRVRALGRILRRREPESITVLDGIDLDVLRGQSVGIIGENGAGKSTLLKIVAGVIPPSRGRMAVHGRLGALLELGAGFHPDYTGRENLGLAAALLGLSRRELDERMDYIVEFADIGRYLDEPLRHYSSGMVVRLGFALIASVRPELLVTDEVLAVGDESFQKKCIRWMEDYLAGGGTLLMVSHGMYHVQKLCQTACWIHQGRMHMQGDVYEVTQAYLAYHERKSTPGERPVDPDAGEYRLEKLGIIGDARLALGDNLRVRGRLFSPDGRAPAVVVGIVRADGTPVYGAVSDADGFTPVADGRGGFGFEIEFPDLPLLPGSYEVRAHAMDPEGLRLFDRVSREFTIRGETRELGFCHLAHAWRGPGTGE
jgi:lipopolysaccharide transport system ATP-binding protein